MPFKNCPSCGKLNSVKHKNCPKCGAFLGAVAAPASSFNEKDAQPAAPAMPSSFEAVEPRRVTPSPFGGQRPNPYASAPAQPVQPSPQRVNPFAAPTPHPVESPAVPSQTPVTSQVPPQPAEVAAPRPKFCPECGSPLPPAGLFCGNCGHRIVSAPSASGTSSPAAPPRKKNPYLNN